ncbi:DnaA regulatory inactivator Hda [Gilvimarinus sp. F26214L]|uniref:DnaA regulatory inactivator Hda n=1 Tax=Gilvimarinus sp. DZF01 TaxID=3461371 RepID=UPI0040464DE8
MEPRPRQLSLSVSLHDEATFANFYLPPESPNRQAVAALERQFGGGERFIYLWGAPGAGLTHLLQAACHKAAGEGRSAQYLPLRELAGFAPEALFEGLETQDLICLDSLEAVAGLPHWEEALFGLFNRVHDAGKHMVFSAGSSPQSLPLQLEDLRSRLSWGVVFHLEVLDDEEKQRALQARARRRGMEMSREVAQFILSRSPRDMNELFYLLNRLDEQSLQEQRKLTIPFVKQVLGKL